MPKDGNRLLELSAAVGKRRREEHEKNEGEEWVSCPFDKNHTMPQQTLVFHIAKCSKNYIGVTIYKCPFNALHNIRSDEMNNHLATCEFRDKTKKLVDNGRGPVQVSKTTLPLDVDSIRKTSKHQLVTDEWDKE